MKVCVLSSGSKGNSSVIVTEKAKILIDLGTTSMYVVNELHKLGIDPKNLDAILITHIHSDHIKGLKNFIKKYKIIIYTTTKLLGLLEEEIGAFEYRLYDQEITLIKDLKINIFKTSHDAGESLGFIIENSNKSLVYITDTGYINKKYFDILTNKDMYVIESNHDVKMLVEGPYPYFLQARVRSDKGHLSNNQTSNYLSKFIGNKTKSIIFIHLSEKNNTDEKVIETFENEMKKNDIKFDNYIVSHQNEPTKVVEI